MNLWYRVFGTSDSEPSPAAVLEHLHRLQAGATGKVSGDEQGWFRAELLYESGAAPLELERYLVTEEGIRSELNTWAAWLETVDSPQQERLMRHMIGTKQVFTLSGAPDEDVEDLCLGICRFLARTTEGIYQVDGRGFFDAEGRLLVPE